MSNQKDEQNNESEIEVLDFSKPSFSFIPKGIHGWTQQGPYLICDTCDLRHAVYIGIDRQMVGMTEEGKPIVKKAPWA